MRIQNYFALVFVCLFFTGLMGQTQDKDWPQLDGFSERTGHVNTLMSPPFQVSDTVLVDQDVDDFTFSEGVIYASYSTAGENRFRAVDILTNQVLWDRAVPNTRGGVNFHPTVSDDLVYIGGQGRSGIYALDRMTGDSVWFHASGSQYGRNVAVKGDRMYAHPSGQGLVCFVKKTGEVLWEYGRISAQTVPVVDEDYVYFTSRLHDTLTALTHEGSVVWHYVSPTTIDDFEAFLSQGDTLFFKTRGELLALNRHTGKEVWKTPIKGGNGFISTSNSIAWNPYILVNHEWIGDWRDTFMIQGYDLRNGQRMWSHTLEPGSGTVATSFGKYLVHVNGGNLQIRNATDGEIIQEIKDVYLELYSRVKVVDGMILAASGPHVYIFSPKTTSAKDETELAIDWKLRQNPVDRTVTLLSSFSRTTTVAYRVYNLQGTEQGISGYLFFGPNLREGQLDVSALVSGEYILSIVHEDGQEHLRFIKQ